MIIYKIVNMVNIRPVSMLLFSLWACWHLHAKAPLCLSTVLQSCLSTCRQKAIKKLIIHTCHLLFCCSRRNTTTLTTCTGSFHNIHWLQWPIFVLALSVFNKTGKLSITFVIGGSQKMFFCGQNQLFGSAPLSRNYLVQCSYSEHLVVKSYFLF